MRGHRLPRGPWLYAVAGLALAVTSVGLIGCDGATFGGDRFARVQGRTVVVQAPPGKVLMVNLFSVSLDYLATAQGRDNWVWCQRITLTPEWGLIEGINPDGRLDNVPQNYAAWAPADSIGQLRWRFEKPKPAKAR